MVRGPRRVAATEYQPSREILAALRASGLDRAQAVEAMARAAGRIQRSMGLDEAMAPITIDPETDSVKVGNLAGVLRIAPAVEVDLAPKFLGEDHPGWREDLLAIANVTGEGGILAGDPVGARYGEARDFASLVGRVFLEQYWANRRHPLRVYQPRRWRDWSLDGDLDFSQFPLVVDEDGLPQQAMVLDRSNAFASVIRAAAEVLAREVLDPDVRRELERALVTMPPAGPIQRPLKPIPARHRRWASLVELAERVVDGFDVALDPDTLRAPGFVVRTWQAWERLVFVALRQEFGYARVAFQRAYTLGRRIAADGSVSRARVTPDVSVDVDRSEPLLVDAKYKIGSPPGGLRVSGTDLQEANAFLEAAGAREITLLYPRTASAGPADPVGRCRLVERVELPRDRVIRAFEVEVRGIGARGGVRRFARELVASAAFETDPQLKLRRTA
jgi:5-methylcytosine-specific restriction enzyme subunit McrC